MSGTEDITIKGESIVEQIRALVEHYQSPEIIEIVDPITAVKGLAVKTLGHVKQLDPSYFEGYRARPAAIVGSASLTSIESLIEHVNRNKDDGSALFACDNRSSPSITAVYDYHDAQKEDVLAPFKRARFCQHRAFYGFPLSDEWNAWTSKNGHKMSMTDFAAFLEDRIIDVVDVAPDADLGGDLGRYVSAITGGTGKIASPSQLVNLSRNLVINESSQLGEAINLATGEAQINFVSTHTDGKGGPVNVPGLFLIAIPIFNNGPAYQLAARLRYRKAAGQLSFYYEMWRHDRAFDHAFTEACTRVRDETELPLFLGKRES